MSVDVPNFAKPYELLSVMNMDLCFPPYEAVSTG